MTKKKRQRKERNREQKRRQQEVRRSEPEELEDLPGSLPDRRGMERMTSRIGRILEEKDFESVEEANAFLNQYLSESDGSLEDAPPAATPLE